MPPFEVPEYEKAFLDLCARHGIDPAAVAPVNLSDMRPTRGVQRRSDTPSFRRRVIMSGMAHGMPQLRDRMDFPEGLFKFAFARSARWNGPVR